MDVTAALTGQAQMAVSAPRANNPAHTADAAKARKAGKDFEAMFMTQMLQHMFSGLDEQKGMFGGGHAEQMFRPMLLDEYGKMIAQRGHGIGLADQVTRSLLATQEVQ